MAGAGKRILLGRIAGAHGIRGEVLIKTFTARPEDIAAYGPLDDGAGRTLAIEAARVTLDNPGFANRTRLRLIDAVLATLARKQVE